MRAILKFDLPEETELHNDALNGSIYKSEIGEFASYLRQQVKYGKESDLAEIVKVAKIKDEQVDVIIDFLRSKLFEMCENFLKD